MSEELPSLDWETPHHLLGHYCTQYGVLCWLFRQFAVHGLISFSKLGPLLSFLLDFPDRHFYTFAALSRWIYLAQLNIISFLLTEYFTAHDAGEHRGSR
jgi:hypothetical protein